MALKTEINIKNDFNTYDVLYPVIDPQDTKNSAIVFTFSSGDEGKTFTITGLDEIITDTVPKSLKYGISSINSLNVHITLNFEGIVYKFTTGNYYGIYFFDIKSSSSGYDNIFNNNTWEQISQASSEGITASLWKVGDIKTDVMMGNMTNYNFSGKIVDFIIIGINHNASTEGNNRLHIIACQNNGKNSAFCDNNYGIGTSDYCFHMNSTATNSGGWDNSWMKKVLISDFKNCLPVSLKNSLKTVIKYTDNTGGGKDIASYVTATTEDCCLLAEFEVQGARTYANSAEQNKQMQYEFFKTVSNKIFYKYDAPNIACGWRLRSVYAAYPDNFCVITNLGSISNSIANYSFGFAPVLFL